MRSERELDVPEGVQEVVPRGRHRQHGDVAAAAAAAVVQRARGQQRAAEPTGASSAEQRAAIGRWRRRAVRRAGVGRGRFRYAGLAVQAVRQRTAQGRCQGHPAPGGELEDQAPETAQPRRHRHRIASGTIVFIEHSICPISNRFFSPRLVPRIFDIPFSYK